jgi:DNA polymerase-3 subunit delta
MLFGQVNTDEKAIAASLGVSPFFMKDYLLAARNYTFAGVESALLLLHQYNLRSIGVNSIAIGDGQLLKELVIKMMM